MIYVSIIVVVATGADLGLPQGGGGGGGGDFQKNCKFW